MQCCCNQSSGLEETCFESASCFIANGGRVSRQLRHLHEQTSDRNVNVHLHRSTFILCPDTTPISPPPLGCPSHLARILLFWSRWRAVVLMTDEAFRENHRKKKNQTWRNEKLLCVDVRDEQLSAVRHFTTSERKVCTQTAETQCEISTEKLSLH